MSTVTDATDAAPSHVPVLLRTTLDLLEPAIAREGAVVLDGTLGLGGHSSAMLERHPTLRLIGVDRDRQALRLAGERLAPFADRVTLVHATFDEVDRAMDEAGVRALDGALYDLGVSSMQLDEDDRGFSYSRDTDLDMRMDASEDRTAADIVNEYDEADLARIFYRYGDEPLARRYASRIVAARESAPILRSGELVAVLDAATPAAARKRGHNAKRVFQALRIEVNRELEVLERAMPAALDALADHGRIVVLSYHSLEDRIVKRAIAARTVSTSPRGLPVELPEHAPTFRMLVKGAPSASDAEIEENPRAASVRLRAAERVRGNAF
jgi:16S rRNA (cytosine1402-N4)-methyltransferase